MCKANSHQKNELYFRANSDLPNERINRVK